MRGFGRGPRRRSSITWFGGLLILIGLGARAGYATPYAIEVPETDALFSDRPDLPGRALIFENFTATFGLAHSLHPPVTPMMAQIYDHLTAVEWRRRRVLDQACDAMLERPTDQAHYDHNVATAQYLLDTGHDVVARRGPPEPGLISVHRTEIEPTGDPTRWLTRLARVLWHQPLPVKLVVSTAVITKRHRDLEFHRDDDEPRLVMSSRNVTGHHATLPIEHELFHNFQAQGQERGSDDVWPDHYVKSSLTSVFRGRAAEYIAHAGYYSIEEIGAVARDAVQTALAIAADEPHRFEGDLAHPPMEMIEVARRAAQSFADPTVHFYRTVLRRLERGGVREADVIGREEIGAIEVPVYARVSLLLPLNRTDLPPLEYVRREVERGLRWLEGYRAFLERPDATDEAP